MPPRSPIPHLDLRAENDSVKAEIAAAIARVTESQQFVLGPEVSAFEEEFAAYCEARFAVGCASGSDSLLLALMALEIGPGDQVVCPSYTFFATASAITRLGGTPVFADIDPRSYNLDPEQARKAAARCKQLRAFLPVDLFGQMADMTAFLDLGREFGVPVIADTAQSVGARDAEGRRAGSLGDVRCFSLYPTKNLGAFGDAGILVTDDAERAEQLRVLRVHGAEEAYFHQQVGINSRLDELQAAILRVKLRHLDGWTQARRANADHYERCFAQTGAGTGATSEELEALAVPLSTPSPRPQGSEPVYHQYAIRVPARLRDGLQTALAEAAIETRIFYPLGLHQQQSFAQLGHARGDLPETEAAANETLCLPIHPGLTRTQIERVVEASVEFLEPRL
jgi:dTDP-4-amino-4,6-dideoxygalactose transaminase